MRHLSRDQILSAVEGHGEQAAHLDDCRACRTRVEELRQVLALVATPATNGVPEPSPLFWNHLSERVREAVAAEPAPQPARPYFNIGTAASLAAALAIIVIGVAVTMRTAQPVSSVAPVLVLVPGGLPDIADAGTKLPLSPLLNDDATWVVMGELASQLNWEDATEAGLTTGPGAAERAIAQMSDEEQREVVELLQSELRKANRL
jgi:hypothetical protein